VQSLQRYYCNGYLFFASPKSPDSARSGGIHTFELKLPLVFAIVTLLQVILVVFTLLLVVVIKTSLVSISAILPSSLLPQGMKIMIAGLYSFLG
jgi:hypothetical protein